MKGSTKLAVGVVTACVLGACAPQLSVVRPAPAVESLGPVRRVAITVAEPPAAGKLRTTMAVLQVIQDFSGEGTACDQRLDEEHVASRLTLSVREPLVSAPRGQADVLLQVTPTDWSYGCTDKQENVSEGDRTVTRVWKARTASLTLSARAWSADGKLVRTFSRTASFEMTSWQEPSQRPSEDELMTDLAREASEAIVAAITPSTETDWISLEEAPEVEPALKLIAEKKLDEALSALGQLVEQQPRSAAARYDLGVLHEARGELARARQLYAEARAIEDKRLYRKGLERLDDVERDERELGLK